MSSDEQKSFPSIPTSHWWTIRDRFKVSIPDSLDAKYITAHIAISETSAGVSILPALRTLGLIDNDGKVNKELAANWRDDETYPKVCEKMIEAAYPKDLIQAVPDPLSDAAAVTRWISSYTKAGDSRVGKMTRFYLLLAARDPDAKKQRSTSSKKATGRSRVGKSGTTKPRSKTSDKETGKRSHVTSPASFHINLQIHISPQSTAEQIELIFKSMATHLGKMITHDD